MAAKKFILSDSSIENSYGFSIDFKTINLDRFKTNPVMLYQHDQEKVIGRWDNINIEDGKLTADAVFDSEDTLAKEVSRKLESGFLKGCSVGIIIGDFEKINGKGIAKDVEILEASIVAVPSDKNAMVLYDRQHKRLSADEIVNLFSNYNNMTQNEKQNETVLLQQKDAEIATLKAERDALLKEKEDAKKLRAKTLVEDALTAGKITADKKDNFVKLAETDYDLAKSTLDAMQGKTTLHNQTINNIEGYARWDLLQCVDTVLGKVRP